MKVTYDGNSLKKKWNLVCALKSFRERQNVRLSGPGLRVLETVPSEARKTPQYGAPLREGWRISPSDVEGG